MPLLCPKRAYGRQTYGNTEHAYSHVIAQKLPVTVPELVELSPSITVDNALVLGSKQTTVFMLDRRTGKLLKTFSSQDSATLLNAELDNEKTGEAHISFAEHALSLDEMSFGLLCAGIMLNPFAPQACWSQALIGTALCL
jgi:hypothetical protein